MRRQGLIVALATALLTGCALGPEYERPQIELPAQWNEGLALSMQEQAEWANWWTRYRDPLLDELVADALANNLEAATAAARIEQARAQLGLARAERYPTLNAQAEASRGENPNQPAGGPRSTYLVAGALNYEVDLWGRLARSTDAARARLLQVSFTEEALRLAVVTDVVTSYFDLRATERQIRTTQETIESRQQAYELEESRFRNGATTELTLRQAEAELAQAQAQLPLLLGRAAQLRRALATLRGAPIEAVLQGEPMPPRMLTDLAFDTRLPERLPSELLERRPDLRAAEAGLIAANADIGVARASWLPRLNLSATLGSAATDLGDLFTGPAQLWSLGGSVLAPLLDFGRREAQLDSAEAARDVAELQYRATVRDAFREVGDAWTLLETASSRLEALNRQVAALEISAELAQRRYANGYSAFIEVLDARRALYAAQLSQTEALRDRLTATATLFKAMGGGWE